jgi:hypothetical protein
MCGVDVAGNKGKRTSDLCGVAPLETGAPFETIENQEVWHPKWEGKIDDGVNSQFIKAAADRIWENEQVSISIYTRGRVLIFHRGCGTVKMGREKLLMMISRCQRSQIA